MIDHDDIGIQKCVGVIQLYNKDRKITSEDIKRIESIQRFLGAAVTRVGLITSSLTVMIGISKD